VADKRGAILGVPRLKTNNCRYNLSSAGFYELYSVVLFMQSERLGIAKQKSNDEERSSDYHPTFISAYVSSLLQLRRLRA
jgi:hypothetical protein